VNQGMRGSRRCWVVVCVLAASGCGADDSAPEGAVTALVDTLEGGRRSVVNTGPEWAAGGAWTAEEDLRIGTLEGDGPDQLGQVSALKVDAQGRMYVLDYLSQDIRVFESDGSHAHTIGRAGQGPGELMRAAGLNWGPEGNLWVWDPGGRFSIFTPEGDFVDSRPRGVRGVIYPWRGEFDVDGTLIDWGLEYPGMSAQAGAAPPTRIIYYPVRFSSDFAVGDTLPTLNFDFEMNAEGERMVFGEILSSFQDRQGAIWFAHNKTFTLYRRTLEGDTTLQFSLDATPEPVARHEVDSVRAIYIDQGRADRAPAYEQFAESKPMIRRIFSDEVGQIFVLSEQQGLPLGTFVDVFRDSGEYLGRMDLPARVNFPYPPPAATDTHLYYITTDEFDVEYVVRMRLNKPGAG
jgi:6-bladed beta-propeller protein